MDPNQQRFSGMKAAGMARQCPPKSRTWFDFTLISPKYPPRKLGSTIQREYNNSV
jgi:hypothetical protein